VWIFISVTIAQTDVNVGIKVFYKFVERIIFLIYVYILCFFLGRTKFYINIATLNG
jgi:hypothetical protein